MEIWAAEYRVWACDCLFGAHLQ